MTLTYEFDGNDYEYEVEDSDLQRALTRGQYGHETLERFFN